MIIERVFFIFFITVVSSREYEDLNDCSSYGELCYQNSPGSCCQDLECKRSIDNRYRCTCKPDYEWSNNQCQFVPGTVCSNNTHCERLKYTVCSANGICSCQSNYIKTDPNTCQGFIGAACSRNHECFPENSVCIDGFCQCKCGYLSSSYDKCLPTFLELSCVPGDEKCEDEEFTGCLHGKCYCKSNHVVVNSACAPLLYESCAHNKLCAVEHSICDNSQCKCKPYYKSVSNNRCLPTKLYGHCRVYDDCRFINDAKCTKYNDCGCADNYFQFNETTCALAIGGKCRSNDDCLITNSFCFNGACKCKNSFQNLFSEKCQPVLHRPCQNDNQCFNETFTKCSEKKKCECLPNYITSEKDKACLPSISGICDTDADCITENSYCHYNRCQCKRFYNPVVTNGIYSCVQMLLGDYCINDDNCQIFKNAICYKNSCICPDKYYALENKTLCLPSIGGSCIRNSDCQLENTDCYNRKCRCKPNYSAVSEHQCVTESIAVRCTVDIECGEPWHAKCSSDRTCFCTSNNTLINRSTCSPILGGACWKNDHCTIRNSVCDDNNCRCKSPQFKSVANNLCVPNV